MQLVIDVGNTNTVLGLFHGKRLIRTWRVESNKSSLLKLKLPDKGVNQSTTLSVSTVTVSTVVPSLSSTITKISKKLTGKPPFFVSTQIKMPIRILLPKPKQLGQDRIVNAAAAYELYGGKKHLLVIDLGTATTIDVITPKGEYIGGTISPGIGIANKALHEQTALLPLFPIKKPQSAIGNTTKSAIQSGVFYGYAGLIDGLAQRIQKQLKAPVKVIATGGLSQVVCSSCSSVDLIDPNLTLKGLRQIADWNR